MHHRHGGFTLVELLVTITVVGILLGLAVPSYRAFVIDSRMTAQANELLTSIAFARSEAVKRNAPVSICASSNQTACTGNWHQGWIVRVGTVGAVLRVHPALTGNSTIQADVTTFTYTPTGTLAAATPEDDLVLCNPTVNVSPGRTIEIGLTGRGRVVRPDDGEPATCI